MREPPIPTIIYILFLINYTNIDISAQIERIRVSKKE
jgi:hypothetical protein